MYMDRHADTRATVRGVASGKRPDELACRLRERLEALGPAPRAELLHVLMLPDLERAHRIGEFWGHPETRIFGELLIDLEEEASRTTPDLWLHPRPRRRPLTTFL